MLRSFARLSSFMIINEYHFALGFAVILTRNTFEKSRSSVRAQFQMTRFLYIWSSKNLREFSHVFTQLLDQNRLSFHLRYIGDCGSIFQPIQWEMTVGTIRAKSLKHIWQTLCAKTVLICWSYITVAGLTYWL